jgi:hypothetical protein
VLSSGWLYLGAMIVAYGVANLLQSVAASRTRPAARFHPGLLLRLCADRAYLIGVGCQFLGFLLAFFARRELPLFLVQGSVAAGLGVTVLLGVAVLGWRLPAAELGLLALLCVGVAGLVISARPAASRQVSLSAVIVLGGALVLIAVLAILAGRWHGAPGSVILGSLAGLAFGAAAIAARPLASEPSWAHLASSPLLYLLVAHSIVGQILLGLAMQRGSTTAAVAAMDAASAAPAAVIGLLLLGDRVWPGREWLAALGLSVTLVAVVGLSRYAQPQHQPHRPSRDRAPEWRREPVAVGDRAA